MNDKSCSVCGRENVRLEGCKCSSCYHAARRVARLANEQYAETLAAVLNLIRARLERDGVQPVNLNWDLAICDAGPINYEQGRSFDFQLRSVRAWLHINIYRMHSGRYELNTYVL